MRRKRWKVVMVAAVFLVGLAEVKADVYTFNGLAGGDFSAPAFAGGKPMQLYDGIGSWNYYESTNAFANVVGTGEGRHAELSVAWYPRGASMWYTSAAASAPGDNWKVSADLMAVPYGNGNANRRFAIGVDQSNLEFYVDFRCPAGSPGSYTIEWKAGSQTGSTTSTTSIVGAYKNVSIEYDSATGAAKASLGDEVIFDVTTDTGLVSKTICFINMTNSSTYDTGKFYIDNVVAVPEPTTVGLLMAGGLLASKRNR